MSGLIYTDDDTAYRDEILRFTEYYEQNFLNVSETKEMILDFRQNTVPPPPIFINGAEVERVTEYKYLGVVLDNKLEWSSNFDNILKKLDSRFLGHLCF